MARRARVRERKSAEVLPRVLAVARCVGAAGTANISDPDSPRVMAVSRPSRRVSLTSSLYLALRPRVAQIVRALLGENPSTDLVHDICVDVALSESRFRGESAFPTWVYAVVSHRVHNWIRNERNHRNLIREAQRASLPNRAVKPDETVDAFVLVEQLRIGFAMLTEAERACLTLVRCESFSPQEAATILDSTPDAVRMNVHRARLRLRRWIEEGTAAGGPHAHTRRGGGRPVRSL